MEEDKKVEGKKALSPIRQQRSNRSFHRHRNQSNREGENPQHQGAVENAGSHFRVHQRSFDERRLPPVPNNTSAVSTGLNSADESPSLDYHNGSGLNGVRQLLDNILLPSVDGASGSPGDAQNNISISSSTRTRNASPPTHRGERRRVRRRMPSHPTPGQSRSEMSTRNLSPLRVAQPFHASDQHVHQSRYSTLQAVPSPATSPSAESATSRFMDGLFGDIGQLGPFPNPYLRGHGTENEPFELSPDAPSSPPAYGSMGSVQSDEEIARQLQQEEWEAAHPYGGRGHNSRTGRGGAFNSFHYPFRRSRIQDSPPLRLPRTGASSRAGQGPSGEGSSQHFGGTASQATYASPVFRPLGHRRRSQEEPLPMRLRLDHWSVPSEEVEGSYGNLALLTDLLSSYGLSDWADIEAFLNPGPVGQRPFVDLDYMDYESLLALGEQLGEVSKGMEQSDIDKLSICIHKSSTTRNDDDSAMAASVQEPPQCNICLCDYDNGDEKRVLPCKHEFHKHCVDQWLKTNATCPICRSEVKMKRS